ncbi:hypothetical protein GCM10029964_112440 [Kibdelosporangium lantanae]
MSTKLGDSLPHNTSRRFAVLLGAVALAGSLAAAPASAATGPDLRVDLSFDDHEYLPDEGVAVQVTITNVADWPNYANSVTTTFQNIAGSSMRVWSTSPCCAPTSLAPGQSTVVTMTLGLANWTGEQPTVALGATTPGEANPGDNAHKIDVRFVPPDRTGGVSGLVYADRNDNHQVDDGEALTSGTATLNSLRGPQSTPSTRPATTTSTRYPWGPTPSTSRTCRTAGSRRTARSCGWTARPRPPASRYAPRVR